MNYKIIFIPTKAFQDNKKYEYQKLYDIFIIRYFAIFFEIYGISPNDGQVFPKTTYKASQSIDPQLYNIWYINKQKLVSIFWHGSAKGHFSV